MATVCLDKSSAKIACLIFSILLGLVSGFDMPDISARLDSQGGINTGSATTSLSSCVYVYMQRFFLAR